MEKTSVCGGFEAMFERFSMFTFMAFGVLKAVS